MDKLLGQDAIDALFDLDSTAPARAAARDGRAETYNFAGASQISGEQMRAISTINDQFARSLVETLGAWFRTDAQVVLALAEQAPFSEYLSRVPEPNHVSLVRLEPLGGVGVVELDLGIALTMVDLLLGGQSFTSAPREATEIESAVLASVIGLIVRELNNTWAPAGLNFALEKRDKQQPLQRVMPNEERTLCIGFELEMMGARGLLNLCLPAVVLNTVHRRLVSVRERPRRRLDSAAARLSECACKAETRTVVRLPAFCFPAGALSAMAVGAVLETPLPKTTAMQLLMRGDVIAQGTAMQCGDHRGLRLHPAGAPAPRVETPAIEMAAA